MKRRVLAVLPVALLVAGAACAEVTRTVRATLAADPTAQFTVENLVGRMTVTPGDGDEVVAVATIHAESADLADSVNLEQVYGKDDEPTLRVRYPIELHSTLRYPGVGHSSTEYDGRRVTVSGSSGVLVYAEVEIRIPRRSVRATFRNLFGALSADRITGKILLDTASANVTAHALEGTVKADVGSGDVRAEQLKGSFTCDTGSGACEVIGFDGDVLRLDTGSGGVRVRGAKATKISADTGSGSARIEDADAVEVFADTGSGAVELGLTGSRLRRIKADTGSGGVTLRLPADASFELLADQGSGDLTCDFADARPVVRKRTVVGYRRGDGRIRIDVDTGSGDVTVKPTR
jgi:hypothetical protein